MPIKNLEINHFCLKKIKYGIFGRSSEGARGRGPGQEVHLGRRETYHKVSAVASEGHDGMIIYK